MSKALKAVDNLAAYLLAPQEEVNAKYDYNELADMLREVKQALEQAELNSSKDHIEHLKSEIASREHRIIELQLEAQKAKQKTKPVRASGDPGLKRLRGQFVCEYCCEPIIDRSTRKPYNYCPFCGREVDK